MFFYCQKKEKMVKSQYKNMKNNKFITIYVTHSNMENAEKIVNFLLSEKLIACSNYSNINVAYHWKTKIVKDSEVVSLLKTRRENWVKIKEYIENNHPYETPCILKTEVEANEEYVKWIYKETN